MSTVKQPIIDSESDQNVGEVCIANISPAERHKRLRFGLMVFGISLIVLALLVVTGADRLWRLPLVLLFFAATSGYFQWHDKTCVGLANLNSRKIGDQMEKIEDTTELAQVQRQATGANQIFDSSYSFDTYRTELTSIGIGLFYIKV